MTSWSEFKTKFFIYSPLYCWCIFHTISYFVHFSMCHVCLELLTIHFWAGIRSKDRYIFSKMTLFWGDFEFVGSSQIIERGQWYFLWKIHSIKTDHNRPLRPRHYWFWNLKNWKIPKQNSSSSYESVTPNKIIKQQLTSNTDLNNWEQGGTTTFIVNVLYYGTFLYFSALFCTFSTGFRPNSIS